MQLRSCLVWFLLLLSQVASQTVNLTVDDSFSFSPTNPGGIQYFPSESSWSSTPPTSLAQRFNQTIHVTNASDTRVMYFFQGDAIYYYGDKGPGYGALVVNVDGEASYDTVNASSSTLEYQRLLWSRTGLGPGDHQVIVSRYGNSQITMDYFRVASSNDTTAPSLAGPGASVVPKEALIVDDTVSSISYSGGWELVQSSTMAISPRNACFFRNTIHRTTIPNAMANFTFSGTAVWYFSDIDYTHGFVQVSVDGAAPEQVTGTYHQPHLSQRLIWYKTGLLAGQHVVSVAHGGQPNQYATVDFFMYLPSNATPSASTPSATNQTNENESRSIRMSVIIGGAIGGVIGLGAFLYGAFLVYQRRVQWKGLAARSAPGATAESELYESMPFIITPQSKATTTPTHGVRSKLLDLNSVPSHTSTSGMSEYSFSTSGLSTSRGFTDYNPHDPPPSYPYR